MTAEQGSQRGALLPPSALLLILVLIYPLSASASASFLLEEPYGTFGALNPTGHAAIYLDNVCADAPTHLRPCREEEPGVVLSRYHHVGGYDWVAIPVIPYLYAVDSVSEIPERVDKKEAAALRDAYRRKYLLDIAPTTLDDRAPKGDWTQLVGASFNRRIDGLRFDTTPDQDLELIAILNDRRNVAHFNLFYRNCADFSRSVLQHYMPDAIRRNVIADFGIMTPKQIARSLVVYDKRHPELHATFFTIPQVPGNIHRSHSVDGVAEALVKSKKYVIPLTFFAPQVTGAAVAAFLVDGRLKLPKDAPDLVLTTSTELQPSDGLTAPAEDPAGPAATSPATSSPVRLDSADPASPLLH
ncbi:hypothetical protein HDF16_001405 [Granulicella aggregans]|uniref:DUF4105 domain-containing protein n=1 Tax=Granulicella aggregans TaxID=474949 RepID=A0A7W8E420_9BACT|nr:hypothetical protein [Granulicella aggregans]MBB5056720.1 hypothetical protein [Granulicella aggregans]